MSPLALSSAAVEETQHCIVCKPAPPSAAEAIAPAASKLLLLYQASIVIFPAGASVSK